MIYILSSNLIVSVFIFLFFFKQKIESIGWWVNGVEKALGVRNIQFVSIESRGVISQGRFDLLGYVLAEDFDQIQVSKFN